MLTSQQLQRLSAAAKAACLCEKATGLPAEITVAQWALESGWGASAPGNNCFGIKAYDGCQTQTLATKEFIDGAMEERQLEFAAFDSLAACFECHARLITEGKSYTKAWANYLGSRDLQGLIADLAPIYATDPAYADKLRSILAMAQVQTALALARKGNS
jgi:flagellar protein FlgJ